MKVHWMNYVATALLYLASFLLIGLSIEVIDWFAYLTGCLFFVYSILINWEILKIHSHS